MNAQEKDYRKLVIMGVLSRHVGREKAVGMGELFERVFDERWENRINDTRKLRKLIEELQEEVDLAICSTSRTQGGGYYIADGGSELDAYIDGLVARGLKPLHRAARLKRMALPQLLGQMRLNLEAIPRPAGQAGNRQ